MEQVLTGLTDLNLSNKLKVEQANDDELPNEYVIKPLTPNISNFTLTPSGNYEKSTEKLKILKRVLKKLNQSEGIDDQDKDCADVSHLETDDILSGKKEHTLPPDMKEKLQSTINSMQEHIAILNLHLKDADYTKQQIENNIVSTLKDIDKTYQSLLDDVCRQINMKREQLILETEILKHENLIELQTCRVNIQTQIQNAQSILSLSENMLQCYERCNFDGFLCLTTAVKKIDRIPTVSYCKKLPDVSFNHPLNSYKEEIIEQISKFGCISRTIPVQITNIEERPAGLFVKWHVTDPEYTAEEHIFVVEKANGKILDTASKKFEVLYTGPETFCFVRNIALHEAVTLRVGIQADNFARSAHHIAQTSILPYSWELDNKDYVITNNGKVAAKLTDTISTLFSHSPQYDADHIIEFKFLEVSQEGTDDEGIALVYDPQGSQDTLKRQASFMITSQGKIFMNGEEKVMLLPKIRVGTNITITSSRKSTHVLRINIESENKCVTYDWRVQTPLYFAARFTEYKKWMIK